MTPDESDELLAAIRGASEAVTHRFSRSRYLEHARTATSPRELYAAMAEQGLFALGVPEEYGGNGGGLIATAAVMETLSAAGTPPLQFSLTSFCRHAIVRNGTPEQIHRFVVPTLDASATFSFAVTEPDAGTNSFAMKTAAERQPDGSFLLRGQKVFISGAADSTYMLVAARSGSSADRGRPGLSLFVVDTHSPGVSMTPMKIDWKAPERQYSVWFDDVTLPADRMIGEDGHGMTALFDSLNAERVVIAAWALGMGRYVLDKAVRYARDRAPFGTPIGAYQAVAHPLARARAELDAAGVMIERAAARYDRGEPSADEANIAKLLASEAAYHAVDAALQTHGGAGFDEQTDVITLWPMIRVLRIAPLNNEMVLNYIAQHMLGLPRSR